MTPMELARMTGTSVHTIRFYSRIGLLKPRKNRSNGYREYSERDAALLLFARQMRDLGLCVADVRSLLRASERPGSQCTRIVEIIEGALPAIERDITRRLLLQRSLKVLHRRSRNTGRPLTGSDVRRLILALSLTVAGERA